MRHCSIDKILVSLCLITSQLMIDVGAANFDLQHTVGLEHSHHVQ